MIVRVAGGVVVSDDGVGRGLRLLKVESVNVMQGREQPIGMEAEWDGWCAHLGGLAAAQAGGPSNRHGGGQCVSGDVGIGYRDVEELDCVGGWIMN